MKNYCGILGASVLVLLILLTSCSKEKKGNSNLKPPIAEKHPKELNIHGHTRIDNYYWLNERENPKVKEYLEAENDYTKALLEHTEDFQKVLYDEIVGRIKQQDESVPYKDNGYFYYTRYEEGKEYPIYCRKKETLEAPEEIILNVNDLAEGRNYIKVIDLSISLDNRILAYGVDTLSRRKYDIYFKNLETGETYNQVINNTTGKAVWANDNKTIFFTRREDETLRAYQIYKYEVGKESINEELVFEEKEAEFSCNVYKTKSREFLVISSHQTLSQEYRILKADNPNGEFMIFTPRERGLEYSIDHYGDNFYIVTNWDATNFKLMKTPVNQTNKKHWEDVIAHREDVLLEGIEIFKEYLVVEERKNGLEQIRVINWDDNSEYYVDFDEATYTTGLDKNLDFDTKLMRIYYTSLTTPEKTIDYNLETREETLLKQKEVLGGFDSNDYQSERLYATARDGEKVPISLVYKKGIKKDGNNPLLLYSYGSYGISARVSFRSDKLSLLDRGFVYAVAHIRGGQEMGRQWYEDGKLLNKINTYTDFIDCGKYLIEQKFTNSEKLFAYGGSAGGLLMGAVLNMEPDLWKGVIAAVPFVDVVTTMLDESIPLTTFEYDEWGNPNQKEYYEYMLSYSPYDQVKAQAYPAILVTTGFHDSQVQYWEPAKWVAKLRDMKTDDNVLLFDCDMESGHGGASGRFKRYKRTALTYTFIFDQLGIYE